MAIYKMNSDALEEIPATSFAQENIREREDLERLLRDRPDAIEEGLFILSDQFSRWQGSGRSIDLLGLDAAGQLMVIELKRTESGDHAELQAIRYAAMVANMTMEQAIDAHRDYLTKRGLQGDPQELVEQHLENVESGEIYTEKPRIILVSGGFSTELTTSVLWLNDNFGLDIKCIRLQPYRNSEELLVEASQIIPLPEAVDYQTRFREREKDTEQRQKTFRKAQLIHGEEAFKQTFDKAQEEVRPGLNRLYDAAVAMKNENIADLYTHINSQENNIKLRICLPGTNRYPVSFSNLLFQEGTGEINFWPAWEEFFPESKPRIDQLIGPATSKTGVRHRRLSTTSTMSKLDEILEAIHDAYREANGLPPAAEDMGGG